jgi:hypothetical protein
LAAQRSQAVGDTVPTESLTVVPDIAEKPPVTVMDVTLLGEELEITYSRSWELAIVQYEKESIFTSMKVRVPLDQDLEKLGEFFSDKMNELQGTDLNWARELTNNRGSLITRLIVKK